MHTLERLFIALRGLVGAGALALALGAGAAAPPAGREAAPASEDPVLEARVMSLSAELRCLVCQNETVAASHASLAVDLRKQVREMLRRGQTEAEVLQYMTDRYGDFVLYRPPLRASTALLWFGPALLLLVGAAVLLVNLRRRSRMSADRFEPEIEVDDSKAERPTSGLPDPEAAGAYLRTSSSRPPS